MRITIVLSALLIITLLGSCYYDNLEELRPAPMIGSIPGCDSSKANVTYTTDILPIFQNNCLGCHTGNGSSSGIDLTSYEITKTLGQSGRLLSSVVWDGQASNMPKGPNKINECNIALIRNWVKASMPQ